jgi:DNA helicase-2/ATP-dependent DNA helicase PcrA
MSSIGDLWKVLKPEPFCPNPNQEKAILHTNGPLYLPAGPGAGKTRVLLWRTVNLIAFQNVRPQDIFLATFTEKAALQLKEGLRSLLDIASEITGVPYDTSRVYVGTAHSLCQRILTDHRFSKGAEHRFSPVLMDELSQYLYLYRRFHWQLLTERAGLKKDANSRINEVFSSKHGNGSSSRHRAVSSCVGVFNRLAEECVNVEAAIRRMTNRDVKLLLKLCSAYQESMESDSVTDFANIQRKALEQLNKSYGQDNAFRFVIIDEYQDTNTIQERLYFKLASIHKNLCVVGDDDQALYRFRGATVENFVEFPERCREYLGLSPAKIPLAINYRSRRGIVDFCNEFIAHSSCNWKKESNKGFYRVPKKVKASRTGDEPAVIATQPGDLETVCKEVASMVKVIVQEGRVNDPNEIAFLFPSLKTKQAAAMKDALIEKGLKVYAPRAGRLLEVQEAKAIFGLFLLVFGRPNRGDGFGYTHFDEDFRKKTIERVSAGSI